MWNISVPISGSLSTSYWNNCFVPSDSSFGKCVFNFFVCTDGLFKCRMPILPLKSLDGLHRFKRDTPLLQNCARCVSLKLDVVANSSWESETRKMLHNFCVSNFTHFLAWPIWPPQLKGLCLTALSLWSKTGVQYGCIQQTSVPLWHTVEMYASAVIG